MQQYKQIQKYLQDTYLTKLSSHILEIKNENQNSISLLLEQNIFHPQGGGQPDDEGSIQFSNQQTFNIQKILNDRQAQLIYLQFQYKQDLLDLLNDAKQNNQEILQIVNQEKRQLYSYLHSAGHFLDVAVKKIGLKWIPGKGYHFPDGPYVEYIGQIEGKAEDIQQQIQQTCDLLLNETQQQDGKIVEYLNEEQLQQKLGEIPAYLKGAQNVRFIKLCQFDDGCPCGGTHVNHIKDFGKINIVKVQKKGKNIRVSYKLN